MTITPKKLVRYLKKNGWQEVKQEGSHLKLRKEGVGTIVVPMHNKDLGKRLSR